MVIIRKLHISLLYHNIRGSQPVFWWYCTRNIVDQRFGSCETIDHNKTCKLSEYSEYEDSEGETGFNVRVLPNFNETEVNLWMSG